MNTPAEVVPPGIGGNPVRCRAGVLRSIGGLQAAVGLSLLVAPGSATRLVGGESTTTPPAWITRLLGLRMTAQGIAIAARPSALVALAGAVADGSHAASMVLVPSRAPRYRRAALISAAAAGTFSVALTASTAPSLRPLLVRTELARLRRGRRDSRGAPG